MSTWQMFYHAMLLGIQKKWLVQHYNICGSSYILNTHAEMAGKKLNFETKYSLCVHRCFHVVHVLDVRTHVLLFWLQP